MEEDKGVLRAITIVWNLCHLFQEGPDTVPVLVRDLKLYGCLWVPFACIEHVPDAWATAARLRPCFVCNDHLRSRCVAGDACSRVHVSPAFLNCVRRMLMSVPFSNCCLLHGDPSSQHPRFGGSCGRFAVEILGPQGSTSPRFFVAAALVAATKYWDGIRLDKLLSVREHRVCRLHQQRRCNFGHECGNVHICRRAWALRTTLLHTRITNCPEAVYFITIDQQYIISVMWCPLQRIQMLFGDGQTSLTHAIQRLRHTQTAQ